MTTDDFKALYGELDEVVQITDPAARQHALGAIWDQVKDEKDNAWAVYLKGRILMMLGKPAHFCIMYLHKSIQMDPTLYPAMTTTGLLLRLAKKYDDAIDMLKRAEETARNHSEATASTKAACATDLGSLLQATGDVDAAKEAFQRALDDDDKYWPAYSALAVTQEKEGSLDEAMATLKGAVEKMPEPVEGTSYTKEQLQCLFAAGVLHTRRDEWAAALTIFARAWKANPDEWNVLSKIIQCHAALGNIEERNTHIRHIYALKMRNKVPADRYCREQISTEYGNILAFEIFMLAYDKGLPVLFMQWEKPPSGRSDLPQMVSFGSNERLNQVRRNAGQLPENYRLYHIDAHGSKGEHTPLEFIMADTKPSYDYVRQKMLDGMLGKAEPVEPVSAQVPDENPMPDLN